MKCKGLIAVSKGDVRLVDVEVTDPGCKEIQVRMVSTLISAGTERAHILALPNSNQEFPYIPGYCCAGVVEKVGKDAGDRFAVGDRVACYAVDVGHREIGNVPIRWASKIPNGVSFDYASFTALGQTSLQGVRKCKIEIGESTAVLGLGIVGQLALQLVRINGALPAIGIDRIQSRLEIALSCGADFTVNNEKTALPELLKPITDGKGPAVVLDSTGFPEAMAESCEAAANYARVCILGCPRGLSEFNFYKHVQKKSINLIGAHAVDSVPIEQSYPNFWTYVDDATCFLNLVKKESIHIEPLISDRISWKNAENMYQKVLNWDKNILGIVISWSEAN